MTIAVVACLSACGYVADKALEHVVDSAFEEISELPDDWPADIPVHPAATPRRAMRVGKAISVTFATEASVEAIRDWYVKELATWNQVAVEGREDNWSGRFDAPEGKRTLLIAVTRDSDLRSTVVLGIEPK